ncbi:MAG: hypothetical protein LBJ67_11110 [Planctomycetaceae bacterium]|jgi:hypothetical protein|nr:hypothetical protein [Planctomycetaceae bacterium]
MKNQILNWCYFVASKIFILLLTLTICFYRFANASDLTEWLRGGRGSRTTVSQPYVPPIVTTPATVSGAGSYPQPVVVQPTPNGVTLPPGGIISTNGVAATGYITANQQTLGNGTPTSVSTMQPTVEYKWSYSTIKDRSYDPITVYDPLTGGYATSYQERQTESVLPWLHRKQVIRYKPIFEAEKSNRPIIGTVDNIISNLVPQENLPASSLPTYTTSTTILPTTSYPVLSPTTTSRIISPSDNSVLSPSTQVVPATYINSYLPTTSVLSSVADVPPALPKSLTSTAKTTENLSRPNLPASEFALRPVQTSDSTQLPAIVSPSQYHTTNPSAVTSVELPSVPLPNAVQPSQPNSEQSANLLKLNIPNLPTNATHKPTTASDPPPHTTAKPLKVSPLNIYPIKE